MPRRLFGIVLRDTAPVAAGDRGKAAEAASVDMQAAADALMRPAAAAARLGLRPKTLERLRHCGTGPPYVLLTPRSVRYRPRDVEAFIESRLRTSTATD
jgi:predicted DNA-binding transcriptional regulator AlpA